MTMESHESQQYDLTGVEAKSRRAADQESLGQEMQAELQEVCSNDEQAKKTTILVDFLGYICS